MARLQGRVAIVTGEARGIAYYARALVSEGARVIIGDLADGTQLAGDISAMHWTDMASRRDRWCDLWRDYRILAAAFLT